MADRPALLVLVGPTAVGKTGLAVQIAKRMGAEVVSADSVAVYRGLDIGSGKPTPEEMAGVPHHLLDVADPEQDFHAARFASLADQAIANIASRGQRALVAGGTGLYVKALLHGLAPAPPVDRRLRARLGKQWEAQGGPSLHARLARLDPAAAERIHPADRQRVIRALEVCLQTGQPFSRSQAAHRFGAQRYPHCLVGLNRPRPELFERIEARCRKMWESGLVEEVRGLLAQGVDPSAKSLRSLGYSQAVALLNGKYDQEQALAEMIKRTKAYAKRQLTWFNKIEGIQWHQPEDLAGVLARARQLWEEKD